MKKSKVAKLQKPEVNTDRLKKLLRLAGSAESNEALAALRAAQRMLPAAGWDAVIGVDKCSHGVSVEELCRLANERRETITNLKQEVEDLQIENIELEYQISQMRRPKTPEFGGGEVLYGEECLELLNKALRGAKKPSSIEWVLKIQDYFKIHNRLTPKQQSVLRTICRDVVQ